jgi:hypothetical protein
MFSWKDIEEILQVGDIVLVSLGLICRGRDQGPSNELSVRGPDTGKPDTGKKDEDDKDSIFHCDPFHTFGESDGRSTELPTVSAKLQK